MLAGFLTRGHLSPFEDTLRVGVALAAFIPIIADMAGNTGTQALAVVVRSMALKRFVGKEVLELLRQEASIGLIVGTVCGILVAFLAVLWHGNPFLGFVVGVSMWVTLIVSTMIGALMPVLFNALGVDPAVAWAFHYYGQRYRRPWHLLYPGDQVPCLSSLMADHFPRKKAKGAPGTHGGEKPM